MTKGQLGVVLERHKKWLDGQPDGERANLSGANLRGANIDYACWPLWCGSKGVKVDAKIAAQLAAHFCALDCTDEGYLAARMEILKFAKTSHRAEDLEL